MNEMKNIEVYLSTVRHDLRNQLTVIREGMCFVVNGLGKKDCAKCFEILKLSLKSADELNELINKLLSYSAIKSALENQQDNQTEQSVSAKDG